MDPSSDLTNQKLKLEIELLAYKKEEEEKKKKENENISTWTKVKLYIRNSGALILGILSFITVAIGYLVTIKEHFDNQYKEQVISWGGAQDTLIELLGKNDQWAKRKAAFMLAQYGVNTLDYLILKMRVLSTAKDELKEDKIQTLFYTMKLLKENNDEGDFNETLFKLARTYELEDVSVLNNTDSLDNFYTHLCSLYSYLYTENDRDEYVTELGMIKSFYLSAIEDSTSFRIERTSANIDTITRNINMKINPLNLFK